MADFFDENEGSDTFIKHLSIANYPNTTYTYYSKSIPVPTENYWDLGSVVCYSEYSGICDKFISLPAEGCSGPGCGSGMWQDAHGKCYNISDYKYDSKAMKLTNYIWPHSYYNRYYSTCNSDVELSFSNNCQ